LEKQQADDDLSSLWKARGITRILKYPMTCRRKERIISAKAKLNKEYNFRENH
jgi:hypothetical protein